MDQVASSRDKKVLQIVPAMILFIKFEKKFGCESEKKIILKAGNAYLSLTAEILLEGLVVGV